MTSLNTFVLPEAVHIITDGQTYLGDTLLPAEVQKVAILGNLPAVIGVRGAWMLLPTIIASVSQNIKSFDDLISIAPDLFRAACNRYWAHAEQVGDKTPRRAHFVIAGWSGEREQLEAYTLASDGLEGAFPWRLALIKGASIAPWDEKFAGKLGTLNEDDLTGNLEGFAVRLTELQRDGWFKHAETGLPTVGGDLAAGKFVQLTTLTRDGISTRIVKRWGTESHG